MITPKTFNIKDKRYYVHRTKMRRHLGRVRPELRTIELDPTSTSETYWHELTHLILHSMRSPLWRDEVFVTRFSKRLDESIRTARFK